MLSRDMIRRVKHCAVVVVVLLVVSSSDLSPQAAVAKRNVNLREGPATTTTRLLTLQKNDEMELLDPQKVDGFYNVRVANGDIGWVYAAYVRVLTNPPVAIDPTGPPEVYRSCGLEGNATQEFRRQSNALKNRVTAPTPADIDQTITLERIAAPGDDRTRWTPQQAASIVGYVVDVKPGGKETVNCGDSIAPYKDAHIELVVQPTNTVKKKRVIVEITPRWRAFLETQGVDWSTTTLANQLENKWVRFTGWLFFDGEHDDESENTTPGRTDNWRATAWEIHPVTSLKVCGTTPVNC
jgi:hypothetical protein